jgi:hypothetical protein
METPTGKEANEGEKQVTSTLSIRNPPLCPVHWWQTFFSAVGGVWEEVLFKMRPS